jgi:hypothetical protein
LKNAVIEPISNEEAVSKAESNVNEKKAAKLLSLINQL